MTRNIAKLLRLLTATLALGGTATLTSTARADDGWTYCSSEHHFCHAPHGSVVRFGADGSYAERVIHGEGIPCTREAFGSDPTPNVFKHCKFRF